ncbi:hypothetical protein FISHEDRAFT_69385 [Fistulina hepatica ATCC 64428]|uniref:Zn(2)-C6 fungal-type domain-containing protein n=1 Tax=Fistulina hepatica ATCC 64428 TaxID=1128425 RepID=A0A0D7AMF5_9AGAR|nr:hypothetical protein FISHEDRAFT_69385 [Fistulina hepatica ATCC 64428]
MLSSIPTKRSDDHDPSPGAPAKKRRKATRLSCAECRRLKLRCDRSVPCSSCVKRGCGAICPDGSLTTGLGNRFVLASTQELHEKISELANRVRQLEDALRTSHARYSTEQHPLLAEELLKIKAPLQREAPAVRNQPNQLKADDEHNPDVVDAFGSLSISLSGRTKYFGQTANSWYFLQNESVPDDEPESDPLVELQSLLPRNILARAASIPISDVPSTVEGRPVQLSELMWYLPDQHRTTELRNIYFLQAAWMYNPISEASFNADIFGHLYDPLLMKAPTVELVVAHKLSLMYMVLAIGSLMDVELPAYNLEAEKYHQLARASLFLAPFIDEPTVHAIQALFLMCFYLFIADRQNGTRAGSRWVIMGIAVKMAQSIGLHRDSGRWKLVPSQETQRRRELFWEIYTYDSWQCLTFGRPPSVTLAHVDCKMPYPADTTDESCYHSWKHLFTSECMSQLHDQAFNAKTPSYTKILQLDRKMRAFPVPQALQVVGFGGAGVQEGPSESVSLILQRHIVLAIREMNLLYLHRSFFARAISEHSKDPLGSPYGTSVIAAYRSAGSLVALMRNLHAQLREPSERIWFLWTHMFSCAIVLGSIVTKCPSLSLAPSALAQLDGACELFQQTADKFRARRVLMIMLQLRQRAHNCLDQWRKGAVSTSSTDDQDELSVLGGKTRLVKEEPASPQIIDRSPNSHNPVIPLPLSPGTGSQMDASVLEYLGSFSHQGHHPQQQYVDLPSAMSMYPVPHMPPINTGSSSSSSSSGFRSAGGAYTSFADVNGQSSNATSQRSTLPSIHAVPSMGYGASSTSFPQYFPVYDYSSGSYGSVPMISPISAGINGSPNTQRASSSPEETMQSTWQSFVEGEVSFVQ